MNIGSRSEKSDHYYRFIYVIGVSLLLFTNYYISNDL
jgi:hypothetical protein